MLLLKSDQGWLISSECEAAFELARSGLEGKVASMASSTVRISDSGSNEAALTECLGLLKQRYPLDQVLIL